MAKKANKQEAPKKFEDALSALEKIVEELESGDLGLDESLKRYEQGVKAYRRCYEILDGAERRIALLTGKDADGKAITEEFGHQATADGSAPEPDQGVP